MHVPDTEGFKGIESINDVADRKEPRQKPADLGRAVPRNASLVIGEIRN